MLTRGSLFVCTIVFIGLLTSCASGQSVEVAKDYYQHGLNDKAKEILITLLHGTGHRSGEQGESAVSPRSDFLRRGSYQCGTC